MKTDTQRPPEQPNEGAPPGDRGEGTRPGVFLGTFLNIRFYLDYSWFFIVALVI